MNYASDVKDHLYKKVLNVQQDILLKQYDIEWDEIKLRSTAFMQEITDPYLERLVNIEKHQAKAVLDIRNQEMVLNHLQQAVFNK
jgi:pyruvate formate-lyase activating enzyme-like uncharacterized protein